MKPILFNTEMVRAILDGRKTVTRRVVKGYPLEHLELDTDGSIIGVYDQFEGNVFPIADYAPYRLGDILYVRETWRLFEGAFGEREYRYLADEQTKGPYLWRPSIHMPKEAARLFLRVKDVRVEQLQDIDDIQACAEGADGDPCDCDGSEVFCSRCCNTGWITSPRSKFAGIWDSTIKPAGRALYGWAANPWVWVIEFERITKEEAEHG